MTRADIGEYDILLIGKGYFPDDEVAFIDDKGNVKTWAMFKKVYTQHGRKRMMLYVVLV